MNDIILKEFKENAVFRLDESLRMITIAFSKIADDMLWKRPTELGMALGNQILHSCGNMTQYVCTSLAERVDERKRDLEFSTNTGLTKEELLKQTSFKKVTETLPLLKEYSIQVNPREINLFYLNKDIRERIVFEDDLYKVLSTNISWSKSGILKEVSDFPERFSPNVIMRPLYQEVILPNLCYIGGGGELAYWMQLKNYFDKVEITFPILLLRNSALIQTEKQAKKLKKLDISLEDVFLKRDALINKKVREISNIDIDLSVQKNHLKQQFENLYHLARKTDESFLGAIKAQEIKQLKGLENLEKRLLKAQKRKIIIMSFSPKHKVGPAQGQFVRFLASFHGTRP